MTDKLLYTGSEWDFDKVERTWEAIDKIGREDFRLEYYPVQLEIISSEQMIDCYSSHAMPHMYHHWSFGKSFIQNERSYQAGQSGLAYEVVINTDPCIAYLMEDNTMTLQTLVMAHAGCGHNSFFTNNYMFKDWTDASTIISYLKYAKEYIQKAEDKLGKKNVEAILDAAHALQWQSVNKYNRTYKTEQNIIDKEKRREEYKAEDFSDLWRTIPTNKLEDAFNRIIEQIEKDQIIDGLPELPEENILYFIRKHSPSLCKEEREILKIVGKISQYFYPQTQTQLMNEGWATFMHYEIMGKLEEDGLIDSGSYLEFLESHSGVVMQPEFDKNYYSGINVYALGFAMFQDLKRICLSPTEEDIKWFPELSNTEDWIGALQEIAYNFKDESFVLQYLSPKVIRDFSLFAVVDDEKSDYYEISGIHDDEDVYHIRQQLSSQYNIGNRIPDIEITNVNIQGDRELELTHNLVNGVPLEERDLERLLDYIEYLWGHDVVLVGYEG